MAHVTISRRTKLKGHEWDYHVSLDARTGRLKRIDAGCRQWPTFAAAIGHYEGTHTDYTEKWSPRRLRLRLEEAYDAAKKGAHDGFIHLVEEWHAMHLHRVEAMDVLRELQWLAIVKGREIRARSRRRTKSKRINQ